MGIIVGEFILYRVPIWPIRVLLQFFAIRFWNYTFYDISVLFGAKYSRVDQVKFFKGYLQQILLGPLLNTLSHFLLSLSGKTYSNFPIYFHIPFVGICLGPRREYFTCLVKELVDEKMQLFISGDNQQYWYVKQWTLPRKVLMKTDIARKS